MESTPTVQPRVQPDCVVHRLIRDRLLQMMGSTLGASPTADICKPGQLCTYSSTSSWAWVIRRNSSARLSRCQPSS